MSKLFLKEVDKLKARLLDLSTSVEHCFQGALRSLERRDTALAQQVIQEDDLIDQLEVDIEQECCKLMALHQPVATDLRFLVAAIKFNNDLERIADLAAGVAEQALALGQLPPIPPPFDYLRMAGRVQTMLRKCLDALVHFDPEQGWEVIRLDDEVDRIHSGNYRLIKTEILQHPDRLDALVHYLTVSRHLERIADLTTSIAEEVIYIVEGEIVRHTH